MPKYRKGSHTVYELHYHFVFVTKYRKPVLRGGHSKASKRADPRDMWIGGCADRERTCESGSCTSVVEHAAAGFAEPDHAGCEGEKQPSLGKGIPEFAKGVLGAAPLGERVLCVHNRKCD